MSSISLREPYTGYCELSLRLLRLLTPLLKWPDSYFFSMRMEESIRRYWCSVDIFLIPVNLLDGERNPLI